MSKQKTKTPPSAKFKIRDKVRVRHGVKDNDYPDMPIGGWAGTIAEAHDDGKYTVRSAIPGAGGGARCIVCAVRR